MTRSRLLLAVAAVLAGATVLFAVLGVLVNLLLVAVALPFALATYVLWRHASGRLEQRVRREAVEQASRGAAEGTRHEQRGRVGPSARASPSDGARAGGDRRRATGDGSPSMGQREALSVLGLSPGADQQAVRRAYRDRVKATHPDAGGGDEDQFQRVRAAYEALRSG